jgi:predicted AlkP superfamily phosphohydrolase/phosphomutase
MANKKTRKLAVVGFDSVSLPTLDAFVKRGVMPTVRRLMENGSVAQTWPCFPMETGTNWASLATGASPAVTGCNMHMRVLGTNPDEQVSSFPAKYLKAEPIWRTVQKAGGRSIVFDWAHSFPLDTGENIIHVGEDGRPDSAMGALQESAAYTTHPKDGVRESIRHAHVRPIELRPAAGWNTGIDTEGCLEFEMPIQPDRKSRYRSVESLAALVPMGAGKRGGVLIYRSKADDHPLLACRPGEWTDWTVEEFAADGKRVRAALRAKLLILEAGRIHLYTTELYCQEDFVHPSVHADALRRVCGPYIIQCSRQQVVTGGVSDVATYFEEQYYLADWYRKAADHLLRREPWDLFMLKWHGPDWTNHLTMHMIDPRHPMHEEARAKEGWAYWDRLMAKGDGIVAAVVEAAGPDALIALVSDHGGGTDLPAVRPPSDANALLEERGWLHRGKDGAVDWSRSVAYATSPYVYLNVKGREPGGIVEPGEKYERLRTEIMRAVSLWTDSRGRPVYQAVLPAETAGRLGVGGEVAGDVFLMPAPVPDSETMTREEFRKAYSIEESGTWDWPRLNTGTHTDDSFFVLSGPGVRSGYRRKRPTLITSAAPTMAIAAGIPVPRDADGATLWDFLDG